MSDLDIRLLTALRTSPVHLPAGELATQLAAAVPVVRESVAGLREAGFEIEDRPGFGYRLLGTPDRIIADDLLSRLGPLSMIRDIAVYEETDSTNDLALKRGRQGAAGGLAIFAERQTAGRGRFGRRWASASHLGLWFSLLLRPNLPLLHWPRLTTWTAVALAQGIEEALGLATAIKWPNDIYIGEKKVAGILAESGADERGQPFAVVGIGVNVNHEAADFPEELVSRASSLHLATGRRIDRPALAAAVLRSLDAWSRPLETDFSAIIAAASRRSFLLGRWIQVQAGTTVLEGRAEELDEHGHLLLRGPDGALNRLTAGEVTVILN